jgi:hypothetical protein
MFLHAYQVQALTSTEYPILQRPPAGFQSCQRHCCWVAVAAADVVAADFAADDFVAAADDFADVVAAGAGVACSANAAAAAVHTTAD